MIRKSIKMLAAFAGVAALSVTAIQLAEAADKPKDDGGKDVIVDCAKGDSIQAAVDGATGPTDIFIAGTCDEDVVIAKDDITLSGNQAGTACNPDDPAASSTGTLKGEITIDSARGSVEHLFVTGPGTRETNGINVVNRGHANIFCNRINANEGTGVLVTNTSNANLRFNELIGNGTRSANPFIFFDCGLVAVDASAVKSNGNTYADNTYCAIEIDRQSAFQSGGFRPRRAGEPSQGRQDVFVENGCDPATGTGCFTTDQGPVAIIAFFKGNIDLRNSQVFGEMIAQGNSNLRVGNQANLVGNVLADTLSVVRIRDRGFDATWDVQFTGTLTCIRQSWSVFGNVGCGQTCNGPIPGTCGP